MKDIKALLNSNQPNESEAGELDRLKKLYPQAYSEVAHMFPGIQLHRLRRADRKAQEQETELEQTLELLFKPPTIVGATYKLIAEYFGLKTLDSLTTNHMTAEQAKLFANLLKQVREWRVETDTIPGRAFILSSQFIGIGKTHIAEAMRDSFQDMCPFDDTPRSFVNGKPNFGLKSCARLVTGGEFMEAFDKPGYSNANFLPECIRALVLDDIGREGSIKFEKRDDENQLAEKQARYFHLIDHLYKTRRAALFITSNLTLEELAEFFGPATWSRLIEMSGRHMVGIKTELPDMRVVKAKGGQ